MQIVIDIDEKVYESLKSNERIIRDITKDGGGSQGLKANLAILNGTPLPKGQWVDDGYKHGEDWIRGNKTYKCSRCGNTRYIRTDFCPDCGAKMVEPQESEE